VQPYFSIILPIYNVAAYLDRCVRSVLEQDFKDYEIILVNDGSTDESPRICERYAREYACVRVVHKENGGLASARNTGLDAALGRYIWWVDSDDWIEPGSLERLYRASCDDSPDMVKFSHYRVEGARRTETLSNAEPGLYEGGAGIERLMDWALYSAGQFSLSAWGVIYRHEFLKRMGAEFVSERIIGSEDYLFNLQLIPQAEKVRVLGQCFYNYEMRMGSLTQRYKKELPQRYTRLFHQMEESYGRMGLLDRYREGISFFYVWHLMRGICVPNEYYVAEGHTLADGRRNIRRFLGSEDFLRALGSCDGHRMVRKNWKLYLALKYKLEIVLFGMYVVKPGLRKGLRCKDDTEN